MTEMIDYFDEHNADLKAQASLIERTKAALTKRSCPDCADDRCGWEKLGELERAAALVPELLAVVESVEALAVRWENARNLSDGQLNIVARAFADNLRRALAVNA